jgi:sugar lactone lactonase YvrE
VRAEQITPAVAYHGEGPIWDERAQVVRFVDVYRGDVVSLDPATGAIERTPVATVATCVVPRTGGGLAVATERGFTLVGPDGSLEPLPDVWDDPAMRMNDGACDGHGRFFSGSMAYDKAEGQGSLYRLDPDRTVHRVLNGVTISNGIGWTPDGHTTFYVDTPTRRIDAFTYDPSTGEMSERRTAIDLADVTGFPDGLTVDAEGGIWVALWQGSAVHRYLGGRLDLVVEVPVSQVSSCTFGGANLDQVFITTSAESLTDPEPAAGALFVAAPGVRGLPTASYGS